MHTYSATNALRAFEECVEFAVEGIAQRTMKDQQLQLQVATQLQAVDVELTVSSAIVCAL